MQLVRTFTHVSNSQPEKYPALGDPTNTKVPHSNATLLSISLVMVIDILGPEHTLTKRFIKIKNWEALSEHIKNISSVNSAELFSLLHNTTTSFRNTRVNSTSTCNFLKRTAQKGRIKAYLNPRHSEQSLNLTSDFMRSIANSNF